MGAISTIEPVIILAGATFLLFLYSVCSAKRMIRGLHSENQKHGKTVDGNISALRSEVATGYANLESKLRILEGKIESQEKITAELSVGLTRILGGGTEANGKHLE